MSLAKHWLVTEPAEADTLRRYHGMSPVLAQVLYNPREVGDGDAKPQLDKVPVLLRDETPIIKQPLVRQAVDEDNRHDGAHRGGRARLRGKAVTFPARLTAGLLQFDGI